METEVWEQIAQKNRVRKTVLVVVVVLALVTVAAMLMSRTGISTSVLTLEPVKVERVEGQVRVHVKVHNNGLVKAVIGSISEGTTLPVHSVEPHEPAEPEDPTVEYEVPEDRLNLTILPDYAWEIASGQDRALTLVLKVSCGQPLPGTRVEMVAYAPTGGNEVYAPWEGGLADWQERVDKAACA